MADRNLDVRLRVRRAREFYADMKKSERAVKSITTATGRAHLRAKLASRSLGGLSSALRGVGRAGLYAGGALAAGGAILGKRSIDEWREAEKVMRSTEQRIKTTGGIANVTAREVGGLAQAISFGSGIDDEEIQKVGNLLLTFRGIRNEAGKGNKIFTESMRTAVDMAAAYDQSVRSSAIQLGKALQEPAKMASALKRTGAVSDADVKRLQEMDEAGASLLDQQKELLRLVNRSGVRGAAAAEADAFMRLSVAWSNTEEALGRVIGPPAMVMAGKFAGVLEKEVIPEIESLAEGMADIWDPKHQRSLPQNLRLSRRLIRRELGPVWNELGDDLEDAEIDEKLLDAFSRAVPRIAETMGEGGGRAMLAFGKGWLNAPFWSQFLTIAFLGGKLGAFSPLGRMAGRKFSATFGKKAAESLVAQQAVDNIMGSSIAGSKSKWGARGRRAGRLFGKAFGVAAAVYAWNSLKDDPTFGQYSGGEGWGELGRDVADWLPGEDSESKRRREARENRRMNRRLRRDPGVVHGPRTRWDGPLVPPTPGRLPRANAGAVRIESRLFLDGKEIASSTGRHKADKKARR